MKVDVNIKTDWVTKVKAGCDEKEGDGKDDDDEMQSLRNETASEHSH